MTGALLDLLAHVVVDFHIKDIGHEIKRILIVLHFRVQAGEIEAVGQVVFVDFAEVLVASG